MGTEESLMDLEGGVISEEYGDKDFLFGGISKGLEEYIKESKKDNVNFFYNQAKDIKTKMSCTVFASLGAISDISGKEYSNSDILNINNEAIKKGLDIKYGWWIYKAVDLTRDNFNKNNKDKLISFKVDLLNDKYLSLLKKIGKSIVIGYNTTREHYIDSQKDGKLDGTSFVGKGYKKKGGHCIRHNSNTNIDNYTGVKKFNSYGNKNLTKLIKDLTYFRYGYVFFYEKELEEINYNFYNKDYKKLSTNNSRNLFFVLQDILNDIDNKYKPIFETIIGKNESETINRILIEIHGARMYNLIINEQING